MLASQVAHYLKQKNIPEAMVGLSEITWAELLKLPRYMLEGEYLVVEDMEHPTAYEDFILEFDMNDDYKLTFILEYGEDFLAMMTIESKDIFATYNEKTNTHESFRFPFYSIGFRPKHDWKHFYTRGKPERMLCVLQTIEG